MYWVFDQEHSAKWILDKCAHGLSFTTTQDGWHLHVDSDLVVPTTCEAPPAFVPAQDLARLCVFVCVADGVTTAEVLHGPAQNMLHSSMQQMCFPMITPPPVFAQALNVVMHPGLSGFLQDVATKCTRRHGFAQTQEAFVNFLAKPIPIYTHAQFQTLMAAVKFGCLDFKPTTAAGCVVLPCNINLMCTPTDHLILAAYMFENKSVCADSLWQELSKSINTETTTFWDQLDETYLLAKGRKHKNTSRVL